MTFLTNGLLPPGVKPETRCVKCSPGTAECTKGFSQVFSFTGTGLHLANRLPVADWLVRQGCGEQAGICFKEKGK